MSQVDALVSCQRQEEVPAETAKIKGKLGDNLPPIHDLMVLLITIINNTNLPRQPLVLRFVK